MTEFVCNAKPAHKITASQAAQDEFVRLVLNAKNNGTFLDVGSNHPVIGSNSFLVERLLGWHGILLDRSDEYKEEIKKERSPKTVFVQTDALKCDWKDVLEPTFGSFNIIDYMSFDIDEEPEKALARFPFDKYKFRVITAEHDSYRNGKQTAAFVRQILHRHGYMLIVEDVQMGYFESEKDKTEFMNPGDKGVFRFGSVEDWWVMPDLLTKDQLAKALSLKAKGMTGFEAVNWCTREETLKMMADAIKLKTPETSGIEEPRKYEMNTVD